MNSGFILAIFFISIIITVVFLRYFHNKNFYLSLLAGIIIGHIVLLLLSVSGIPLKNEGGWMATELIFWSLHLIIPTIVYIALLYIIYTVDIDKPKLK